MAQAYCGERVAAVAALRQLCVGYFGLRLPLVEAQWGVSEQDVRLWRKLVEHRCVVDEV